MDVRDIGVGTELWLPVEVKGALFSLGDTHAGQGDGEVCGTAIESPMTVTAKIELVKGASLKFPRAFIPGGAARPVDAAGYDVTTGIGPDLMTGARDAVAAMIDLAVSTLLAEPGAASTPRRIVVEGEVVVRSTLRGARPAGG